MAVHVHLVPDSLSVKVCHAAVTKLKQAESECTEELVLISFGLYFVNLRGCYVTGIVPFRLCSKQPGTVNPGIVQSPTRVWLNYLP